MTVDPATFAVLRLDQTLVSDVVIPLTPEQRRPGWGDSLIVERSDVTIDFTPVRFRDPDETILLPSEIRRISVVLTPAARRLAVTQQWSNHRRFVTAGRVVPVR